MKRIGIALITVLLTGCTTLLDTTTGEEPIQPDPEGRSMGEVIDDNALATRLEVNLGKQDPRFKKAQYAVHVNAGNVLLVGQVQDSQMVPLATEVAKSDPQVQSVHNHLTARDASSTGIRANDTWLAVKVRSRMFTTDHFPSSNVNIIVEEGVVYLMGRVTPKTAEQAVTITSEVNGVQKVVTVFSIVESTR